MPRQYFDGAVAVPGIADLQRDLRAIGKDAAADLRKANLAAAQTAATASRATADGLGVPRHVVSTIRAGAEGRYAKVMLGGARAPDALGQNFGARHDVERSTPRGEILGWNQFPAVTKPDRFIYTTLEAITPEPFMAAHEQLIDRVARKHGFGAGSGQAAALGNLTSVLKGL